MKRVASASGASLRRSATTGMRVSTVLYVLAFLAGGASTAYFTSLHFLGNDHSFATHISITGNGAWSRRGLYISTGTVIKPIKEGEQNEEKLPDDFNWRSYLLRYSDLRAGNVRNKDAAVWHYLARGAKEGRSYAKIPVRLRYTACQGLFNQMYAHLNAFILADYIGADVVMPPSVYRHSFSEYFSMDESRNEVKWTPTSVRALLDIDKMRETFNQKGVQIFDTPPFNTFPNCGHPQDAFPQYVDPATHADQVVHLEDVYLQSMHIWTIWDRAAERILTKQQQLLDAGWPENTTVVLDLPCPFLAVMTLTCIQEAQAAAASLAFNGTIEAMARRVIAGMNRDGITIFNGAHMRLEKDAIDWARMLGGVDKYLQEYAKAFLAAGFSENQHIYIASGLLSYNSSKEMMDMLQFLRPFSKTVQYKERYIPADELHALNPEQQALVDFLVLIHSRAFVGLGSSTFSVYTREQRVMMGHKREVDVFVDTSRIGTDALFERTTHFARADLDPTAMFNRW